MAVTGQLRIHREDGWFKDGWWLERIEPDSQPLVDSGQRTLLHQLFAGGATRLDLKKSNATTIAGARQVHTRSLERALHPRYFQRNMGSVLIAMAICGVTAAIAFLIAGGAGIVVIVLVLIAMALTIAAFARLVRAPTKDGLALLDEIEGLKLYLSVAERDELERMPGPGGPPLLDAKRYETLLPFAVALEVEDAWTEKFTAAAGAAAAAAASQGMSWYRGGNISDLGSLTRSVGNSLSSQIASASSPPGSSSGGGGGGSSGGGGGGGGGGGR
jgi:2-methylisocitrate lyase-like PEP mutase family enzyme